MKYFFVFAFLIGSISASAPKVEPAQLNQRFLDGIITEAINEISQIIKDYGLDPFVINRVAGEIALPVPELFKAFGYVENVLATGLSDIKINNIAFSSFRLDFDLELSKLFISVGRAYGEVSGFGLEADGTLSGNVGINVIRVVGHLTIQGGISGLSIGELALDLSLGGVDSNVEQAQIRSLDLADQINQFLSATLPNVLEDHRSDINQLLEVVLKDIIESLLNNLGVAAFA